MAWTLNRFYITRQGRLKAEVEEIVTVNGTSILHVHHSDMGLWSEWSGKNLTEAVQALTAKLSSEPPSMPATWDIPTGRMTLPS